MNFKRIAPVIGFVLMGILLATSSGVQAASPVPDEQFQPTRPPTASPSWGLYALGHSATFTTFNSNLLSFKSASYQYGGGPISAVSACSTYPDSHCVADEFQTYIAELGACNSTLTSDCVDSVQATKSDGSVVTASFVKNFPDSTPLEFKGNSAVGLPAGSTSFLVDIPSAPHDGGSLYLVSAIQSAERQPNAASFNPAGFAASIWAVTLKPGNFTLNAPSLDPTHYSGIGIHTLDGQQIGCTDVGGVLSSLTECAMPVAMPTDISFNLNLKLSVPVEGWFTGRASNVTTSVAKDSLGNQLVSISGNPVKVPTIFGWVAKDSAPAALSNFYNQIPAYNLYMGMSFCSKTTPGPCPPGPDMSILRSPFFDQKSMDEAALWLPIVNNTATVAPTVWDMRSDQGSVDQSCSNATSGLQGIVNTNATVYISGPPTFDKNSGTFDYKVLAPHYLADKSVFQGSYDLVINSALARCLYKFTSAPIGATVSVVSSDGTNQVATSVVGEKDGFLHLGVYGFTFSNPTIQVKLTQAPVAVASPTPAPVAAAPVKTAPKTKAITCVKGKLIKQVLTGTCPTGYKKR